MANKLMQLYKTADSLQPMQCGQCGNYNRHWYKRCDNAVSYEFLRIRRKGKEVDLYSAYRQYNSTTKRSDVDHTELPANTPHLPCDM